MYKDKKISECLFVKLAILLILFIASCNSSSINSKKNNNEGTRQEFVQLFDGQTLNGWEGDSAYWRMEDGVLIGETSATTPPLTANTFLIYKNDEPADFELIADYRISVDGNSGINYRSEAVENVPYGLKGYQADIDGKNNYTGQNYEERNRTTLAYRGEIVTVPNEEGHQSISNAWTGRKVEGSLGSADSLKIVMKNVDWNECRLVVKGNRLQHYINGILMSDVTDEDNANQKLSGLLGIQIHTGSPMKVEFRNARIKQL